MDPIPVQERPTSRPRISAVVPMYGEGKNAAAFLRTLEAQLAALAEAHEIVVVNDGSKDDTRERVLEVAEECAVHYVELSRNFGKENALSAGLDAARGDVVVLLDGDGQHPPSLIPEMLVHWKSGADMVYAVRAHRRDESWLKRTGTAAFYAGMAWAAHVEIPPDAGDFRLLDRRVVDVFVSLREHTMFLRGLVPWVGFTQAEVTYTAALRAAGVSSYTLVKMTRLALEGLTSTSTRPLLLASMFGVTLASGALLYAVYALWVRLVVGIAVPGWTSTVLVVTLIGGTQLFFMGVLGLYLGHVLREVRGRPPYIVAERSDDSAPR